MYVHDNLAISLDPTSILKNIQRMVILENNKIEVPDSYFGAQLQLKPLNNI